MKKWKDRRIKVKKEFKMESHLRGKALGEPVRANVQDWLPVLWDGQEDPDFFKLDAIEEEQSVMVKSKNPKFGALEKSVDDYAAFVLSEEYHEDNDFKHYIFEAAVEAFYGKEFWKVLNSR